MASVHRLSRGHAGPLDSGRAGGVHGHRVAPRVRHWQPRVGGRVVLALCSVAAGDREQRRLEADTSLAFVERLTTAELRRAALFLDSPSPGCSDHGVSFVVAGDDGTTDTVTYVWNPATRVLWRKASGSHLVSGVTAFTVGYLDAVGGHRHPRAAPFLTRSWPAYTACATCGHPFAGGRSGRGLVGRHAQSRPVSRSTLRGRRGKPRPSSGERAYVMLAALVIVALAFVVVGTCLALVSSAARVRAADETSARALALAETGLADARERVRWGMGRPQRDRRRRTARHRRRSPEGAYTIVVERVAEPLPAGPTQAAGGASMPSSASSPSALAP